MWNSHRNNEVVPTTATAAPDRAQDARITSPSQVGRPKMLATLAILAAASYVPPAQFAAPSITPRSSPAQLSLVESAKAGVISTVGGSLASAPAKASALLAAEAFKWGTWEVGTASFATELFVFGVVYRYAVRNDFASRPKQGTVLAFAVFRAFTLISLQASSLSDLGTSAKMLQLLAGFGESAIAFWGAAWALEYCWNRGYARRVDDFLPDFYYDDYTLDQMRGPPPYYRDGPPPPYYDGPRGPRYSQRDPSLSGRGRGPRDSWSGRYRGDDYDY